MLRFIGLVFTLLWSLHVVAQPLVFAIDGSEGGRLSERNIGALEQFFELRGCAVHVVPLAELDGPDLVFYASEMKQQIRVGFEPLVVPATWQGSPLTSTILVRAITGTSSLESLANQRIAYVSDNALLGRGLAEQALLGSGVKLTAREVYLTGDYQGSMTMLLHGDVFAAAIAGPLAHRWAKANDLTILYESVPQDIGRVWIRNELPDAVRLSCQDAFSQLKRESRRDAKMRLFPLWLEGFVLP